MTFVAFFLVLFAAILHALWNFAAKKAAGNLGALWLGLCLGAGLSWPFALWVAPRQQLTMQAGLFVMATGVLHAWYFWYLAKAYAIGDLSVVYPVARGCGVAGTAIVADVLLHESLSLAGVAGIAAICAGSGLVGLSRHPRTGEYTAYLHAVLVGATISGYSIVDKLAVGQVHPVLYISGIFSLAAILLAPYVLCRQRTACLYAYRYLKPSIWLVGPGALCTYLIVLFAFRLGPVSYIVAVREFAVVIGALLGLVVLKEPLTVRKAMGITAITVGLVCVKLA
jgi:uncharacterized membrane protein